MRTKISGKKNEKHQNKRKTTILGEKDKKNIIASFKKLVTDENPIQFFILLIQKIILFVLEVRVTF